MKNKAFFLLLMTLSFGAKAYWQQHTSTRIEVRLDDKNNMLYGFERIVYTNNSPDTLSEIFFHLYPNAYKNDRTFFAEQQVQMGKTDFYYAKPEERGYIDSLSFRVNGERCNFQSFQNQIDVAQLILTRPLLPNDSIIIETPFKVKIPIVFSRLGHTGQAYFISQWFPKPAVYDAKGWHAFPYADQGEFYSEFGSYDVSISLPKNYIVMATGNLQTATESAWIDSLSNAVLPSDTLFQKSFPASSEQYKTINFTEENVHDFAWFADKRWIVRKDTIGLNSGESTIETFAAFLPIHQKAWASANNTLKQTVKSYGTRVGPYTYKTIKAVEGDMKAGGGMEYPTVTVIDKSAVYLLDRVIVHEAGHNWFYGMLGSNERINPWMDEGLNSFYEEKAMNDMGRKSTTDLGSQLEDLLPSYFQSIGKDQPSTAISTDFTDLNYGADVYKKTSLLLHLLAMNMGDEFEPAMKAYFQEWKFKHPQPEDFRKIMQEKSSKNLDWFFDGTINSDKKIDSKIKSVKRVKDSLVVVLENKSDAKVPVFISVYNDDSLINLYKIEPFKNKYEVNFGEVEYWDKVRIGGAWVDYKLTNNIFRKNALFPKFQLQLKPILGLNNSFSHKLYIAPALGFNEYDKVGAGFVLHNLTLPQNRFQFALAPLYSFGSKRINGVGAVAYSWFPNRIFQEIRLQTNIKSFSQNTTQLNITTPLFARYLKVAPSVEFVFREKSLLSKKQHSLRLTQYNISEEYFSFSQDFSVDSLYRPAIQQQVNNYFSLQYRFQNEQTFHPYSIMFNAQLGKTFVKLGLEANKKINYDVKGKAFYVRAYAGKFISTNNNADNSRFYLNTTFSGVNDYLMDGIYFGRNKNEGNGATQVSLQEGAFKMPTNRYASPIGRTDDWLLAINLKTDLPFGKLPVRFYADFATFADAKRLNPSGNNIVFNSGLEWRLFGEAIYIYIPLFNSTDFSNYQKEMYPKNKFLNSIRFSFNLQYFNFMRSNDAAIKAISKF